MTDADKDEVLKLLDEVENILDFIEVDVISYFDGMPDPRITQLHKAMKLISEVVRKHVKL